jgi:hypothetical protein
MRNVSCKIKWEIDMLKYKVIFILLLYGLSISSHAEQSLKLSDHCSCNGSQKFDNLFLQFACTSHCDETPIKPVKKPIVINWPKIPLGPETNTFKYEIPENGFVDLELYRIGNEVYRSNLEVSRKLLEDLRVNTDLKQNDYNNEIKTYLKNIDSYKNNIKLYRQFHFDSKQAPAKER